MRKKSGNDWTDGDISAAKKALREKILQARDSLTLWEVKEKSSKIASHLFSLPQYRKAKKVMLYVSTNKEVDTREIIQKALQEGKQVIVPLTRKKKRRIVPCLLKSWGDLAPGNYGILEPQKAQSFPLADIELVIVPGVAFDREGRRLGRGKGYYDRFLAHLSPTIPRIGLAFQTQMVEKVPIQGSDIPVDVIITETGVWRTR